MVWIDSILKMVWIDSRHHWRFSLYVLIFTNYVYVKTGVKCFLCYFWASWTYSDLTNESLKRKKKQYRNSNTTSEKLLPNYVVTRKGNSTRIIKYPAIYQHELNFRARLSVFVPSKGSNISLMLWHSLSAYRLEGKLGQNGYNGLMRLLVLGKNCIRQIFS